MKTFKIQKRILALARKAGSEKTICPSEVARNLWPEDWRDHMDEVRDVAVDLQKERLIEISQKGENVSPPFKGPIRLRIINSKTK